MSIVGYLQPTYVEKLSLRYAVLQGLIQHYCRRDCGTDIDPTAWNRLKIDLASIVPGPTLFVAPGDPTAVDVPAKDWQQYVIITPKFTSPYVLGFIWRDDQDQRIVGSKLCAAILRNGPTAMRIGPGPLEVWGHHVSSELDSPELGHKIQSDEIIHYTGRLPAIRPVLSGSTII